MNAVVDSIRIRAADDHALLRKGIAMILANEPDMALIAEASNGREAVEKYRTHQPDITLMDLQMPDMNGLDAMIAIRAEFPEARIIILTTFAGDVQILRAMKVGARGYLLKTLLDKELTETIRAVHAGRRMLSTEVSFELAEHATSEMLTPGEIDVLRLITAGNANKRIAHLLSVTEDTVKGRVKNILSKLTANDRTHAAMIGIKRGIIPP
jgi:DNA-binding NarL/FixJ family response regulator